jgi:hypothetical protein
MQKRSFLVAVAFMALAGTAIAHGVKAKFGGVMGEANDLQFELVNKNGSGTIYVYTDHGKDVTTDGANGTLTVTNGKDKTEVALSSSGKNILETKGDAKLVAGSKAIATITFADKKTVFVNFISK